MIWLYLLDLRTWLIGLTALTGVALWAQTKRLHWAQNDLVLEQARTASEKLVREEEARKFEAAVAQKERDHALKTQTNNDALLAEQLANDRLILDAKQLSDRVDALTSRLEGTGPSALACRDSSNTAGTFGRLFKDANRTAEVLARTADRRNAEVRALRNQMLIDRDACDAGSR